MNVVSEVLSHMNFVSFLRRAFKGLANSTKFGINLRTKFIFPKKDCREAILWGVAIALMAWAHLGSNLIPYFDTICPNNFPSSIPKVDFFGFNDIPNFRHCSKTFFKCFT